MSKTFVEHYQLLKRIYLLVQRKGTGRYDEFSTRLGMPIPSLYRRLDELRMLGAEIGYSAKGASFYYLNDFFY